MFIAIIGTRLAGKSTVQDYLVRFKGFKPVYLRETDSSDGTDSSYTQEPLSSDASSTLSLNDSNFLQVESPSVPAPAYRPTSFLMMNSPITPSFPVDVLHHPEVRKTNGDEMNFPNPAALLEYVTRNWRSDFVTVDLTDPIVLEKFSTRPFFMVVSMDAPILQRYNRSLRSGTNESSLRNFVQEHDDHFYGPAGWASQGPRAEPSASSGRQTLHSLCQISHLRVVNSFDTVDALYEHLDDLDLTNAERLRPGWDTYFMRLASLASLRSNCMKRRVGAILVRNKRIVSTGYNGTPRGLTNCNEGGCTRCNSGNEAADECVCLHAEENALLEAGRERVGDGAVLYCNTCPCLKCTIKIIQTGVREVVYNLSYKVDDASAALFKEAGVTLRRHAPPPDI